MRLFLSFILFVSLLTTAARAQSYVDFVEKSYDYLDKNDLISAEESLRAAMRLEPGNPNNYALLMNQACRIMDKMLVSKGGLTETAVDIRLILREALLRRAPVIALCHNHPSGNLRPSAEDDRLTDKLLKACRMMNIRLLDHIIVADGGFYSYCEEGKLN